ncbi:MAG TPA: cell division protein FtsI, partial [Cyanobacteria bacterium UBA11369]|nr:cell division protein FtsI [Cyanobacteria bacterium UBA11369]
MAKADPPSSRYPRRRSYSRELLQWRRQPPKATKEKQQPLQELSSTQEQQDLPEQASLLRLVLVWALLLVSGLALGWNLYRLQIIRGSELRSLARQQQMVSLRPFVPRRSIVDRNGDVLALDRPAYSLYAHPRLFKAPPEAIATAVAPLLKSTPDQLLKQFKTASTGVRIDNSLSEEVADRISALRLDGIELVKHYSRLYPQQEIAADVVGFVNVDHKGQAGVEYSQEKLLERFVRSVRLNRSGNGALVPSGFPEGLTNFDDLRVQLTIDSRLQRSARAALKQQMNQFNAKRGTVLVMDARNGSLLTLVSEPSYDPNQYYQYDVGLFKNWALTDLYEPGSTFKPINVAIALEAGAIKPDTVIRDEGQIAVGSEVISNYNFEERGSPGLLTITQIISSSSNVGMVHIVEKMRSQTFYGWLERLGIGQAVETDLPFSAAGSLQSQESFTNSRIYGATASFGQGFSLTPIQLLQLHGAIANGGKLVTPHVVRGLTDSKGVLYWQPTLPSPRPVFSPETTQAVLEMMEAVVKKGTGRVAQIPG